MTTKFYTSDFAPRFVEDPEEILTRNLKRFKREKAIKKFRAMSKKIMITDPKTKKSRNVSVNNSTLTVAEKFEVLKNLMKQDPNQVSTRLALGILANQVFEHPTVVNRNLKTNESRILNNVYNTLGIRPSTSPIDLVDPHTIRNDLNTYFSLLMNRSDLPVTIVDEHGNINKDFDKHKAGNIIRSKSNPYYYSTVKNTFIHPTNIGTILADKKGFIVDEDGNVNLNERDFDLLKYFGKQTKEQHEISSKRGQDILDKNIQRYIKETQLIKDNAISDAIRGNLESERIRDVIGPDLTVTGLIPEESRNIIKDMASQLDEAIEAEIPSSESFPLRSKTLIAPRKRKRKRKPKPVKPKVILSDSDDLEPPQFEAQVPSSFFPQEKIKIKRKRKMKRKMKRSKSPESPRQPSTQEELDAALFGEGMKKRKRSRSKAKLSKEMMKLIKNLK